LYTLAFRERSKRHRSVATDNIKNLEAEARVV
jgi:hypothetical protein